TGRKNDGNTTCLLQQNRSGGCVLRKDQVWLQHDEVLGKSLRGLSAERRPAIVDLNVVALRPPELLECLPESCQISLSFGIVIGLRHQHANPPHPARLLRERRERPRRRAAEQSDKVAPLQLIELHLLPEPDSWQHTALARVTSGGLLQCRISARLT